MRFKLSELNLLRIIKGIQRRFLALPHKVLWSLKSNGNSRELLKYKNKYIGQTCFLVANGSSLKKMDLSFLENKISFGLNRIYLAYEDMCFTNNFLVSINKLVLEQFSSEIKSLNIPKFLNWECRETYKHDKRALFIYKSFFGSKFGKELNKSINPAATVTYAALQIIYFMGFKKVIIIGLDHNYVTKSKNTPNKTEIRTEEKDENHFHPNYFPKGAKWETPDLTSSDYFYEIAREEFEKDGRSIIDCTIGGKCSVFQKGKIDAYK